ncbi:MAG: glucokinase [Gammaproteobacteria bacterium]|nr:glucokinase [Gammaproteobacteria bacterium]
MRVLAGDIGGTKTLCQVADVFPNSYKVLFEKKYESKSYEDFLPLVKEFLKEAASQADMILNGACLGVAGPVTENFARTTNLPWILDGAQLSKELGIPHVRLINDFQAVGYGLEILRAEDFVVLQDGVAELHGPRVILGAGTGLGEGVMYWNQDHYDILPSEGGHSDFAPTNPAQVELYQFLKNKLPRVSNEDVISGKGLANIFSYLRSLDESQVTREFDIALNDGDIASVVSRFALQKKNPLALQALDMFCQIYGAQAGNLALTCLATGGVYIAGGIAAKNIGRLKEGGFMSAFADKGKMSVLMNKIPVKVVVNENVGLMGSALAATRLKN